jgi:subtilisin family serine protease
MRSPLVRWFGPFLTALVVSVLVASPAFAAPGNPSRPSTQAGAGRAPVIGRGAAGTIRGRYIVVLKKGADRQAVTRIAGNVRASGARIHYTYGAALKGFAATLSLSAVNALTRDPRVAYIQADRVIRIDATQTPATWGLDRIDQRALPLSNSYTYNATGLGVKAYIIDTGLRFTHSEFGGRAVSGFDAVDGGTADDCNGHGTHVAGTVGGATYGVAKQVSLVAVRVLDCNGSGSTSGVAAGIDWVTANHAAGQPAVANMSLGGGPDTVLDTAVRNSIADGVSYSIAAGNSNANACNYSPARVAEAITVGSTTSTDARSSFSNIGTCLDLFAPGSTITSSWYTSDTATNTISGTSMATPHVAGVAALYLQGAPSSTPQQTRDALVNSATSGVVTGAGSGSPNRLLYSLLTGSPPPPPPPPPANCNVETYSATLTGTGDADIHPNGNYWQAPAGTHYGCLTGPSNADFDLALYRWNGAAWSRVAVSEGTTSTENITYAGTAGYYYWRVYSYSGSGAYTFKMKRP